VTRLLPLLLLLVGAPLAAAHTVETIDGTIHEGKIVVNTPEKIVIATTFGGPVTIPRDQVKAVDDRIPPLRDQLRYRADQAKDDVAKLWDLHRWAKRKGFDKELVFILERIITLEPRNVRARKALGHEKVDGEWMSPREKEFYLAEKHEAEMRAKGLVPYKDRWVTPEEKAALEQGLIKDGDGWITEEEYHRRRGEQLIDGEWVRVGEKEAKAWRDELTASRVRTEFEWTPNLDVYYDVKAEHAKRVIKGAEDAFGVFFKTMQPDADDFASGVKGRVRMHLFNKLPAYARFAAFFDKKEKCSDLIKGWLPAVRRQHSFWWVDPIGVVGVYKFPNTPRTFISNAVHNLGLILITRYGFNYRFPRQWLLEGFAYYLEMEALGYSDTFSLSRGGTAASAAGRPAWADSDKWREALRALVAQGGDPPMKRLARMSSDQMHYIELVKSWSVVECLIRKDRKQFVQFVDADKDRANTMEDALRKVYGWGWRDLDRVWRRYVTNGFRHGPPPGEAAPEGEGKE
jgi:hypothetical protein